VDDKSNIILFTNIPYVVIICFESKVHLLKVFQFSKVCTLNKQKLKPAHFSKYALLELLVKHSHI